MKIAAVLFLAFLAQVGAKGDSMCAAGTIATAIAQGSCTVGSLTFDFTQVQFFHFGTATINTADSVSFSPLYGPDPGFRLAGNFLADGQYGINNVALLFTVYNSIGTKEIIGVTATGNPEVSVDASGELGAGASAAVNGQFVFAYGYQQVLSYGGTSTATTYVYSNGGGAPVANGHANLFVDSVGSTDQSSMASITEGDFRFISGMPEPSAWVLLVSVCLLLGRQRNRILSSTSD